MQALFCRPAKSTSGGGLGGGGCGGGRGGSGGCGGGCGCGCGATCSHENAVNELLIWVQP